MRFEWSCHVETEGLSFDLPCEFKTLYKDCEERHKACWIEMVDAAFYPGDQSRRLDLPASECQRECLKLIRIIVHD